MSNKNLGAACISMAVFGFSFASQTWAAGWTADVTPVAITHSLYAGEIVQVDIAEAMDNSAGCSVADFYVIRDAAHVKGALALLTAALISGRKLKLFVTGTCDATGRPNVVGVTLK